MKFSSRVDRSIGTEWDQDNSKKTSSKTSATGEVIDRREKITPINLHVLGHRVLMLNDASPLL